MPQAPFEAPPRFPPVEKLLPHRPPMRLIDAVVEELEDGLVCKVLVGDDFVFLRNGRAELAVCVELVAQAVGCCVGLADLRRGDVPRPGLLVGCREADFFGEDLRAGDVLFVKVRQQWVRDPVASFVGEVTRGEAPGGERVAQIELCAVAGLSHDAYEAARE